MNPRFQVRLIDVMVFGAIVVLAGFRVANRSEVRPTQTSGFTAEVKLDPLNRTAVQADGRLRSFESHAKTYMGYVSGPREVHGQSNGFTYLDLMFRPQLYADVDLIYVKNKSVRQKILDVLKGHPQVGTERAADIIKSGLISRVLLSHPNVTELLRRLGQDLIRTSKSVDAIQSALTVSDGRFLLNSLHVIVPPHGGADEPWLSISELTRAHGAPTDDVHSGLMPIPEILGLDPDFQEDVADSWSALRTAWQAEDAMQVNTQVERLATLLTGVAPDRYPSGGRLAMESWYFRNKSMTWVWLAYLAGVVPLLMSVIYKWDGARKVGMVLFIFAFTLHTASLGIRWYIADRWPNSNMFEALTTAAWFGGVGAMILEWISRRTAFRNLFALGSAVVSMGALMAAYFLPAQLDSSINNKMAALNDVWLYIHTNMIISSYAVIGLASIPALLLLRHRWCVAWDNGSIPKLRLLILPVAAGVCNYTGYRLLMHLLDDPARELAGDVLLGTAGAFWASIMVLILEWTSAAARRASGGGGERAAPGGAASLIMGPGSSSSFLRPEKPARSQVYDGATMVLVELSFIMLWTGIVMGAIWADHSWGRPWGWDPKEVFALNTFIIFLVLIHVRLKVRDKAFWTAILAVVGFEVMMFNWIVVNFVITGLHSYA